MWELVHRGLVIKISPMMGSLGILTRRDKSRRVGKISLSAKVSSQAGRQGWRVFGAFCELLDVALAWPFDPLETPDEGKVGAFGVALYSPLAWPFDPLETTDEPEV